MSVKILVADEDSSTYKQVAAAFRGEDDRIYGAGNAREALLKIKETRPDIMLVDADLPGLSGAELCGKIKNSQTLQSLGVILLSANSEKFDDLKSCGADGFLAKPLDAEELSEKVNAVCGDVAATEPAPSLIQLSADSIVQDETREDGLPVDSMSDEVAAIIDEMLNELDEALKEEPDEWIGEEQTETPADPMDESLAELKSNPADSFEDLETAFQDITSEEKDESARGKRGSFISELGEIEPESENLLERLAPSAFMDSDSSKETDPPKTPPKADAGDEPVKTASNTVKSYLPQDVYFDLNRDEFADKVADRMCKVLENAVYKVVDRQVAGLSESILRATVEIIREAAPRVAREVIREEIKKIRDDG